MKDIDKLFEENIQLAMSIASSHEVRTKISAEEFEQNVLISLWDACKRYNPKYGTFEEFLRDTLPEALTNVTTADASEGEVPVAIDSSLCDIASTALQNISVEELQNVLISKWGSDQGLLSKALPYFILELHEGHSYTIKELAELCDTTPFKIQKVFDKFRKALSWIYLQKYAC